MAYPARLPAAALWPWLRGRLKRVVVQGESMLPTLSPGEQLFYEPREGLSAFSPGEILVLRDPRHASRQLVKRLDHLSTEGQLWLLGDCPDRSTDSRHWGYLSPQHVLGRVRYRLGAPLLDQDRS